LVQPKVRGEHKKEQCVRIYNTRLVEIDQSIARV
jgi:hypothetical protein